MCQTVCPTNLHTDCIKKRGKCSGTASKVRSLTRSSLRPRSSYHPALIQNFILRTDINIGKMETHNTLLGSNNCSPFFQLSALWEKWEIVRNSWTFPPSPQNELWPLHPVACSILLQPVLRPCWQLWETRWAMEIESRMPPCFPSTGFYQDVAWVTEPGGDLKGQQESGEGCQEEGVLRSSAVTALGDRAHCAGNRQVGSGRA